ncbi:AAA family ATPase [Sinosporangium siamense]|uniref:ATPase n=1 Tax=Sinosporangium siamense TaxID=1367973 RepID=A0A919RBH6_9ACTN|nr:ATP-binding protein [Sinosporangium siamense]GII90577.1 ATPase [Sinosporangium siamense]
MTELPAALDRLAARMRGEENGHEPGPASLDHLTDLFGLSHFERDVVLMCAGVELDPVFAAHVGSLPEATSGRPTFAAAFATLPAHAHWSALAPGGPLRHWRLIELDARAHGLTRAPIRLDERILHHLMGADAADERLSGLVRHLPPIREAHPPGVHGPVAERAAGLWRAQPYDTAWPVVLLAGPDAAARRATAERLAALLDMRLSTMRARDLPGTPAEREALARLWERESVLSDGVLLIEADDGPEVWRALWGFLGSLTGGVVLSAAEPLEAPPGHTAVRFDLPPPSAGEREAVWRQAVGRERATLLSGHLGAIAAQFRIDGDAVARVVSTVLSGGARDARTLAGELWEACRRESRPRLDALARRVESAAGWDDLVLPGRDRETLHLLAAAVRGRARVHETWGLAAGSTRGLGLSALFSGPGGTGKSLAAEVIANDLKLDLYRVDLATVFGRHLGETERNLRRLFAVAEYGGAVLLFDDADTLFGQRGEVSCLLRHMESYRGLVILTTNVEGAIDGAFLRRIRHTVVFPHPGTGERKCIWQRVFPASAPLGALSYDLLAQLDVPGGTIRDIALGAAFLAADEDAPIGMGHVHRAAIREYGRLGQALIPHELHGWPAP